MEAFSLLKYWRGAAATSSSAVHGGATAGDSDKSDDGPFFDLKLSVPLETGSNGSPNSTGSEEKELRPEDPEPVHNGFSRLKSATNFRVLLLKLKKNSDKATKPETEKSSSSNSSSKFFTVKFKVEEISMFKRENSSAKKKNNERRFSKEMQRYLKMVSKRYGGGGERFSGETEEEGGERRRRDDSLVQQQDGIQSAILHCKRSFNSSRDAEMSILSRSVSDPSQKCSEESKEKGF